MSNTKSVAVVTGVGPGTGAVGLRADQSRTANSRGIDRARAWTEGYTRRLRADRRGDRFGMDAQAMAESAGRILHQACG